MSHEAVFSTCQMPCRLGLPSGMRGKASGCAAAAIGTARRTVTAIAYRISQTPLLIRAHPRRGIRICLLENGCNPELRVVLALFGQTCAVAEIEQVRPNRSSLIILVSVARKFRINFMRKQRDQPWPSQFC